MEKFEYSVAIRTLGTAGTKYQKLIDSIKNSNIQPKNIFVVLPEGYKPPDYQIGTETFIYSKKGMVAQRLKALEYIDTEYALFCDDDVEFESTFVEKLADPLINNGYSCSAGPLLDFFPPDGLKYLFASLLGGACTMIRDKENNYVRILNTGGWSYNRDIDTNSHKIYNTESLAWTCFLIKTDTFKNIKLHEEYWLDKNGYAAFDDQTMAYKLVLNNYKVCIVSDAIYKHNDAKTSTKDLKLEAIYSRSFNHYIFWHRFLYTPCKKKFKKTWLKICINYAILSNITYNCILLLDKRQTKEGLTAFIKGYKDSKKFVKNNYLVSPIIH